MPGMSAPESVGAVKESSGRTSGEGTSCACPVALSITTSRAASSSFMASATLVRTLFLLVTWMSFSERSMLADRSRMRTTVSTCPPPQPRNPPASGRAIAKTRAATARERIRRMRICLRRFLPRESLVALSRNCIAPHSTVRNLRRFSRWMMTGIETAKSPQSIACWRKVIFSLFSANGLSGNRGVLPRSPDPR